MSRKKLTPEQKEHVERLEQILELNLFQLRNAARESDKKFYETKIQEYAKEYSRYTGKPYVCQNGRGGEW